MRDVAVMSDPIEQLAAARIVIPAPVPVHATFDVRHHLRWTDPHFVIEFRRWRRDGALVAGARKVIVPLRQADFDVRHFPDQSVANNLAGFAKVADGPLPGTGLPDDFVFL